MSVKLKIAEPDGIYFIIITCMMTPGPVLEAQPRSSFFSTQTFKKYKTTPRLKTYLYSKTSNLET